MKGRIELGDSGRSVAANVKRLREARGWSLRALSEALAAAGRDLSQDAINKIENGREEETARQIRRVDVDDLAALAAVFLVDPGTLLNQPDCSACCDAPPPGFACTTCGAKTPRARST